MMNHDVGLSYEVFLVLRELYLSYPKDEDHTSFYIEPQSQYYFYIHKVKTLCSCFDFYSLLSFCSLTTFFRITTFFLGSSFSFYKSSNTFFTKLSSF